MKFGSVPLAEAEGAVLAHTVRAGARQWRKGHRLDAGDIAEMREAGVEEVVAAILEDGDISEDEAARRVAAALAIDGVTIKAPATGRANIHALAAGIFTVDKGLIDALNSVDPTITLATLADFAPVEAGQMVATVKIIPFAVAGTLVDQAEERARRGGRAFAVHPFQQHKVGVIQTTLPSLKPSILDKTARITEARLARSGSRVVAERRTAHSEEAVAAALAELLPSSDLVLVFGASAMSDRQDVIPAAISRAGGTVERVGMPVDPGNLLVLGQIGGKKVFGAPGCARSPKLNGFDWVLDRTLAGLKVSDSDIAGMGVGGLLMEIPTRPQPREAPPKDRPLRIGAVLLAAGRSSRMGGPNKLLAEFDGVPLARRVAERLTASAVDEVVAVTGHQSGRVRGAMGGLGIRCVDNPDYQAGLASSLRTGIRSLSRELAGALVVLGDMPGLDAGDFDRMVRAFRDAGGRAIVRATQDGKPGNPVLLPSVLFGEIEKIEGDMGARHLVETSGLEVVPVEIGPAAAVDVDTPDAMERAGGVLQD